MSASAAASSSRSVRSGTDNGVRMASNLSDIVLVDQLHTDTWCEGIVVRPSGDVLATRVDDAPELYSIRISSQSSGSGTTQQLNGDQHIIHEPVVIHRFPDATGAFNICRIPVDGREEYAVITGHNDTANQGYHSIAIWRISFDSPSSTPTVAKIASVPEASFCLGLEAASHEVLAVADVIRQRIWRVHIPTGTTSVLFDDPATMAPLHQGELFSVNRVRIAAGYVWYTNHSSGILYRAPVERTNGGADIRVSGPGEVVARGLAQPDGLVVKRDGSVAYVVSYTQGLLWRVDVDRATGAGTVSDVLDDLITPTGMDLVYENDGEEDWNPMLYIICCGAINPTRITGSRGAWIKFANVDSSDFRLIVTVTTTTEVTYSSADEGSSEVEAKRSWVSTS